MKFALLLRLLPILWNVIQFLFRYGRAAIAWTHARLDSNPNWVRVFVWCFAACVLIDLALVFSGFQSISLTVWLQTEAHPTLIAAGNLGFVYVGYLVRHSWRTVLLAGCCNGHLFIHW